MSLRMLISFWLLASTLMIGCSEKESAAPEIPNLDSAQSKLYSMIGSEHQVRFQALYRTPYRRLEDLQSRYLITDIKRTTQFLFGPLTHRDLGGVQKGEKITPHLDQAFLRDERVMVPYDYEATWMIQSSAIADGTLEIPLPYSVESLRTPKWQNCTDNGDEEHRTWGFFWYFWDPERFGCDHQQEREFQIVKVLVGEETAQTEISYPEYKNLIRMENGVPTLSMTFAFGYVQDNSNPNPFKDGDFGMREFQKFYQQAKMQLLALGLKETPIYQRDYTVGDTVIGGQFYGMKNKVALRVSIVSAAGVDQMDLFAHSFAKKHEGFFAWFGHSRVGSGFDSDLLRQKISYWPEEYTISPDYQLIYWAGCNSYSYYTLPFFEMKAEINAADPKGTRALDLISNTLPSLFAFNAANAQILMQAMLTWETPTSYQMLVNEIEMFAQSWGRDVIVNVLGDEDNQ